MCLMNPIEDYKYYCQRKNNTYLHFIIDIKDIFDDEISLVLWKMKNYQL
jgi:hypothetical protein